MKKFFQNHRPQDLFRIGLVVTGIAISTGIIFWQLWEISKDWGIVLIILGVAGAGAILSAAIAGRIALRTGKEPLARIFISFSHSDTPFVDKLALELVQRGFEILRADRAVLIGDIVSKKLTYLWDRADFLIVVISNESLKSRDVLIEARYFKERQRKIFPVWMEEVQRSESRKLLRLLGDIQFVDLTKDFNEGLKKLVYSLDENAARIHHKQGDDEQSF